jgi:hypothetical protein
VRLFGVHLGLAGELNHRRCKVRREMPRRANTLGAFQWGPFGRQLAASAGYCPCGRRAGSLIAAEYGSLQLRSEHSIRASAVGCRLSANARSFFYVPDVARLPDASDFYEGPIFISATARPSAVMLRRRDRTLIGHASIAAQLVWCNKAGVGRAVFTHGGSQIVRGDARKLDAALRQLCREHGVEACFACDGDWLFFVDNRSPRWTRRPA